MHGDKELCVNKVMDHLEVVLRGDVPHHNVEVAIKEGKGE
jgi:hypothetical protein